MKKQVLKYYISPEINNKFLSRNIKLVDREYTFVCQFKFYDVKLIKNVIAQELLVSKRPKLSAVILKKNITVNLKSKVEPGALVFLQNKPMIWRESLYPTFNISENFFKSVFTVKNNKLDLVVIKRTCSIMDMMIKSAYFD